jgi:hypothetical protein
MATSKVIQARIDKQTAKTLAKLRRRTGMTDSELIREGLRLLADTKAAAPRKKIIGLGKFSSGIPDLATNKKYMVGFGSS